MKNTLCKAKQEKNIFKKSSKKKNKLGIKRKSRWKRKQKSHYKQKKMKKMVKIDFTNESIQDYNELPANVANWEKEEQIVYWKSRAIALEIENTVLLDQLRDMYASTIEQMVSEHQDKPEEMNLVLEETTKQIPKKPQREKVILKIPEGKNRLIEMEKIYGKHAQTIMGMETATQLNYERLYEEDNKIAHWPNIPLYLN